MSAISCAAHLSQSQSKCVASCRFVPFAQEQLDQKQLKPKHGAEWLGAVCLRLLPLPPWEKVLAAMLRLSGMLLLLSFATTGVFVVFWVLFPMLPCSVFCKGRQLNVQSPPVLASPSASFS